MDINYCDKVKNGFSYLCGKYINFAYPSCYQRVWYNGDLQIFSSVSGLIRFKNLVRDTLAERNKPIYHSMADLVFNKEYVFLVAINPDDRDIHIIAALNRKDIPDFKPQEVLEVTDSHKLELISTLAKPIDMYRSCPNISPRQAEVNLEWALLYFAV